MTIEQFDKQLGSINFKKAIYLGDKYIIWEVDWAERLLGLHSGKLNENIFWVRCENIELIP